MTRKQKNKQINEVNVLLTFLQKTKNGRYAPIEKTSIPYARINEKTEVIESCEETYYYSVK
ncbi:MAG: hypothetical protein WC955_07270 [Elusimicrobiota bacterium]